MLFCAFVIAVYFGAALRFSVEKAKKSRRPQPTAHDPPTFTRDIAPIIFDRCTECHRPGQSGPFSLRTYAEVKRRAADIAEVTKSRYMPPWLPAPGVVDLLNDRSLTTNQIDLIQRWVAAGAPEGDPADLPPPRRWRDGWQLGEPELVVSFPRPYSLAAEGKDVYRNFVLPVPISGTRYVRAVEFLPNNPRIIHHAVLQVDRTAGSRELDARDPEPGFSSGMSFGTAQLPDGHFVGWTPGKRPLPTPEGMAWRLEPGSDLVVQLHMRPSGKPEVVQLQIGFHFTGTPPTRLSHALIVRSKSIDIPPGEKNYRVTASYELPVEVEALGIYPHAHYLAREMKVRATLPDGTERWLLHIREWDFNWQEEYRYAKPIVLPQGAKISMEYVYDNSADNPRNPNQPPQRVQYGQNSTDEMAELLLLVAPRSPEDLERLRQHTAAEAVREEIRAGEQRLKDSPTPATAHQHVALGALYRRAGELEPARAHFERALQLDSRSAKAHHELADILAESGRFDEALEHFQTAQSLEPERAEFLDSLAQILARHPEAAKRNPLKALELAQRAVALTQRANPFYLETLALSHAALGQVQESIAAAEAAVQAARDAKLHNLAEQMQQRLDRYRQRVLHPPPR